MQDPDLTLHGSLSREKEITGTLAILHDPTSHSGSNALR